MRTVAHVSNPNLTSSSTLIIHWSARAACPSCIFLRLSCSMALSFFPALTRSLAFSVSRSIISSSCSHRQQPAVWAPGFHASQGIPQHLI